MPRTSPIVYFPLATNDELEDAFEPPITEQPRKFHNWKCALYIGAALVGILVAAYCARLFFRLPDPCSTFNASLPSELDPPGCWRAVKYRQLESLSTELKISGYEKSRKQNVDALANLKRCLADMTDSCHTNTYTVVLGTWWYWMLAIQDEGSSGEVIWMRSTIAALRQLNYTLLTASDYEAMVRVHAAMPDVISIIWAEDVFVLSCTADPRCLKDYQPGPDDDAELVNAIPASEWGTIPLWKLFSITYWGERPGLYDGYWGTPSDKDLFFNPLGHEWVLTPFPYPGHTHVPYSIEKHCTAIPTVPNDERKNEIIVLAKFTFYFADDKAPTPHLWSLISNATGMKIVSTAVQDSESDPPLSPNIHSVGHLSISEYEKQVGQAKLMLAIGHPVISPSVYTAMCQGVPVILPYFGDSAVPEGWDLYDESHVQHGPAAAIGPPYVYSYHYRDELALLDFIAQATSTPIERYIPPEMKWDAVVRRVEEVMETDWTGKYDNIVAQNSGVEPAGRDVIIEHCRKENRCQRIAAGDIEPERRHCSLGALPHQRP